MLADSTPVEQRGRAFGVHRAMDTLGAALGPAAAMVMLGALSFDIRTIFWISIGPGLLALILIGFIRDDVPNACRGMRARPTLRAAFAQGGAFRDFLWVTALFTLANSSDTFLLLKAQSVGFSIGKVTGVYLLFNLFYAAVSGPLGAWADVWGRRKVTLLSFFYYALVYLGFALAEAPWAVVVLFVLYGPFPGRGRGREEGLCVRAHPARTDGFGAWGPTTPSRGSPCFPPPS